MKYKVLVGIPTCIVSKLLWTYLYKSKSMYPCEPNLYKVIFSAQPHQHFSSGKNTLLGRYLWWASMKMHKKFLFIWFTSTSQQHRVFLRNAVSSLHSIAHASLCPISYVKTRVTSLKVARSLDLSLRGCSSSTLVRTFSISACLTPESSWMKMFRIENFFSVVRTIWFEVLVIWFVSIISNLHNYLGEDVRKIKIYFRPTRNNCITRVRVYFRFLVTNKNFRNC